MHKWKYEMTYLPKICQVCGISSLIYGNYKQCSQCNAICHITCSPPNCLLTLPSPSPSKGYQVERKGILFESEVYKRNTYDEDEEPVHLWLTHSHMYWFRLENDILLYQYPIGSFKLHSRVKCILRQDQLTFLLVFEDTRLFFRTPSIHLSQQWVQNIEKVIRMLAVPSLVTPVSPPEVLDSFVYIRGYDPMVPMAWEDIPTTQISAIAPSTVEKAAFPFPPEVLFDSLGLADYNFEDQAFKLHNENNTRDIQTLGKNNILNDRIRATLDNSPLPSLFPEKIDVQIHSNGLFTTFSCELRQRIGKVIEVALLRLLPSNMSLTLQGDFEGDYIVRLGGLEEYVLDKDVRLRQLKYVRDAVHNHRAVRMDLIETGDVNRVDINQSMVENYLIDPQRMLFSTESVFFKKEKPQHSPLVTPITVYNIYGCPTPLQVQVQQVVGIDASFTPFPPSAHIFYFVAIDLLFNGKKLFSAHTEPIAGVEWNDWVKFEAALADIPVESMWRFTVWGYERKPQPKRTFTDGVNKMVFGDTDPMEIGWSTLPFADFRGFIHQGTWKLPFYKPCNTFEKCLWTDYQYRSGAYMKVSLPESKGGLPICALYEASLRDSDAIGYSPPPLAVKERIKGISGAYRASIPLDEEARKMIVDFGPYILQEFPDDIVLVASAICWTDARQKHRFYQLLQDWPPISPMVSLQLLSFQYSDHTLRAFAMERLCRLPSSELVEYMPQLIQSIRMDVHTFTPIVEQLIRRCIRSTLVSTVFFWLVHAELHDIRSARRLKVVLACFMSSITEKHRKQLLYSRKVVKALQRIAGSLEQWAAKDRTMKLRAHLARLSLRGTFILPTNPRFEASRLLVDECRVMASNAAPLWLVFENRSGERIKVIFKVGDDLRADMLSLQYMRVMGSIWKHTTPPLYLYLQAYRAVPLDHHVGLIEVVDDSKTAAEIQKRGSGLLQFTGAFSTTALYDWLREKNQSDDLFEEARDNFTRSCAAYCVVTFLLGIGDRHNDNIMCTSTGHIFHIDFGYFLGQRVHILGVPRETTPFVLTKEFVTVMGGEESRQFELFKQLCRDAYMELRHHHRALHTLSLMMLGAGMNEIASLSDTEFIVKRLRLDEAEVSVKHYFDQLIQEALRNHSTTLNFALHMLAGDVRKTIGL